MPQQIRTNKTIVIGLGTTGSQICEKISERLAYEYGDMSKVTWVKFLCLETDGQQPIDIGQPGFMTRLTIDETTFSQFLTNPKAYDESIGLTRWIHTDTIRKLDKGAVQTGAGNIRMVGRLALLHSDNFRRVKSTLVDLIQQLRSLSPTQARNVLGPMRDGELPQLVFQANAGEGDAPGITFIVVGSLCGGTSSGVVSDIGKLVKAVRSGGDESIAYLSLPRADCESARYRKNAYFALLELNHYNLLEASDPPIRFPDGTMQRSDQRPYDFTYLMMPRETRQAAQELNQWIADLAFLNVVCPDSTVAGVRADLAPTPRRNTAYAFSTVGVSYIEFPALRVLEGCQKRLMGEALNKWLNASSLAEKEKIVSAFQMTWPQIRSFIQSERVGPYDGADRRVANIEKMLETNPNAARDELRSLRDAVTLGSAKQAYRGRFAAYLTRFETILREQMHATLLRPDVGPAVWSDALSVLRERLQEMRSADAADVASSTDPDFSRMTDERAGGLARLLGLKGKSRAEERSAFVRTLRQEFDTRFDLDLRLAFADSIGPDGRTIPGVASQALERIDLIDRRLKGLRQRLTRLAAAATSEYESSAKTPIPVANQDLALFVPYTSENPGTINIEYRNWMRAQDGDPDRALFQCASAILATFLAQPDGSHERQRNLIDELLRDHQSAGEDWFVREKRVADEREVPEEYVDALKAAARQPFARILDSNVLTKWYDTYGTNAEREAAVQNAVGHCVPFLDVDWAMANLDGVAGVQERKFALVPDGERRKSFEDVLLPCFPGVTVRESPEPFRVILLRYQFNFPLTACPRISAAQGLCDAKANDWPVFYTRMDVDWKPLPTIGDDRDLEHCSTLAMGLLAEVDVIEVRDGSIFISEASSRLGGERVAYAFPQSLEKTSRMLSRDGRDRTGKSVDVRILMESIRNRVANRVDEVGAGAFVQSVENRLRNASFVWLEDGQTLGEHATQYLRGERALMVALLQIVAPAEADKLRLWRNEGSTRKLSGGAYDRSGYYCDKCDGLIGYDADHAAANLWTCTIKPEHYFGPSL